MVMSKQTGIIVTVIVALLTLCCSCAVCGIGGLIVTGETEWSQDLDIPYAGEIEPIYGGPVICLGLLVWVVPVVVGIIVARKGDGGL
jgi:hypothetical protein